MMLNNKTILITGGTGNLGRKFVEHVLRAYPDVKKIIVFSRNEQLQSEMQQQFPDDRYCAMRYFIGDVRDYERLKRACDGVDVLIHAAAISNVNTAEYNPDECVKTNILGAQNVINAALACKVKNVIALSSDKACEPTTLYGATKLTSDKLFVAANNLVGENDIRFSVVRFPNTLGSQGTAYPIFQQLLANGETELPITDKQMTRFNISLVESIGAILFAVEKQVGGEIFVPKCMSYSIVNLIKAMSPQATYKEIGLRPSEKLHEELISAADANDTIDLGNYYLILPSIAFVRTREYMVQHYHAPFVTSGFSYSSDTNTAWESVETIRQKIARYLVNN